MSALDQLVHMTVRIECDLGRSSGTGFIFNFCQQAGRHVPAIVTNKHVIAGARLGAFHMTVAENGGPKYGEHVRVALDGFEARWVKHPNPDVDLAAFPLAPVLQAGRAQGTPLFHNAASKNLMADAAFMNELNAIEDVVMVGYPNGLWDKKNNLPIARRGVTATPPYLDFEGRPEFMIDCACFPGSSGSPVFLYHIGSYVNKSQNKVTLGGRIKLLGILWGGPQYLAPGVIKAVPIPTAVQQMAVSRIPNNLGYCVKAEQLLAFEEHFDALVAAQDASRGEAKVEPAEEPSQDEAAA
jgi:hypothetical protein